MHTHRPEWQRRMNTHIDHLANWACSQCFPLSFFVFFFFFYFWFGFVQFAVINLNALILLFLFLIWFFVCMRTYCTNLIQQFHLYETSFSLLLLILWSPKYFSLTNILLCVFFSLWTDKFAYTNGIRPYSTCGYDCWCMPSS